MKQLFKQSFASLLLVPFLAGAVLLAVPAPSAQAAACSDTEISVGSGAQCAKGKGTKSNLVGGADSLLQTVTNVLLFIIGAISVIMIIIGGIRYVISNGDSTQITSAKNTILYSVIGLIVALLAFAIVSFITNSFVATPAGGGGNNATQ